MHRSGLSNLYMYQKSRIMDDLAQKLKKGVVSCKKLWGSTSNL